MSRLFTDVLGDVERGKFVDDLTQAYAKLLKEIDLHGKAGCLKIELKVVPNGCGACFVNAGFDVKAPKVERAKTLFFIGSDGSATRQDPRQNDLPLRDISEPTTYDDLETA